MLVFFVALQCLHFHVRPYLHVRKLSESIVTQQGLRFSFQTLLAREKTTCVHCCAAMLVQQHSPLLLAQQHKHCDIYVTLCTNTCVPAPAFQHHETNNACEMLTRCQRKAKLV